MNQIKFITLALILTFTFGLPFRTWAIDTLPPIPVSDSALRDKEAGITVFGFTVPGTGWDALANVIVKKLIESMVNSTVSWINNGFEGNPAYVTNPKQYFTDIADGVAIEFIGGTGDALGIGSCIDYPPGPYPTDPDSSSDYCISIG